jgi:prepilin-type N-terminal cleavage/methylation domain-containing protein/prepilin-type processing-associated H-X9-DG protein
MIYKKHGFTLTEILVSILIIGILSAIILSALSSSRRKGQITACVSNMHQLNQSLQMYISDYDDTYPDTNQWEIWSKLHNRLFPLCSSVDQNQLKKFRNGKFIITYDGIPGYAINNGLCSFLSQIKINETPITRRVKSNDIAYPSMTVTICEQGINNPNSAGPDPYAFVTPYPYGIKEEWKRHNGGANYAFVDGHVKWHKPEQVSAGFCPPGADGKHPSFAVRSTEDCAKLEF